MPFNPDEQEVINPLMDQEGADVNRIDAAEGRAAKLREALGLNADGTKASEEISPAQLAADAETEEGLRAARSALQDLDFTK